VGHEAEALKVSVQFPEGHGVASGLFRLGGRHPESPQGAGILIGRGESRGRLGVQKERDVLHGGHVIITH